ncbi:MAG: hypothetical protein V3T72_04395, partial [Thermoanaerobaculia bacterium]
GYDNVTVVAVRRERLPRSQEARGGGESSTEEVGVPSLASERPRRSRRWRAGAGIAALGLGLGVFLGATWQARRAVRQPAAAGLTIAAGVDAAAVSGARLVAAGPGGLDGRFDADTSVTALGPWTVAAKRTVSILAPEVAVELRAPRILFDAAEPVWQIRLASGSRMEIRQASIRAPRLTLEVVFRGQGGSLRIEDSYVELGKLVVRGSEDALFEVRGGALRLPTGAGTLQVDGPRVVGVPGVELGTDPEATDPEEPVPGTPIDAEDPSTGETP